MESTITITFGEQAENGPGQQMIGNGLKDEGFTLKDLKKIAKYFREHHYQAKLIKLHEYVDNSEEAAVLVIRKGVDLLLSGINQDADDMYHEQSALKPDSKYYDLRRNKVLNKNARHNLCFGVNSQMADYQNKKGTIIAFDEVPCVKEIRRYLGDIIGDKCSNLNAEGNYYYDLSKCGIGYHGDSERKMVIAVRLGASMPLCYQWFYDNRAVGERIDLAINHGDIYFMSEKATGWDWKKRKILTLRHAAGAEKYLKLREEQILDR